MRPNRRTFLQQVGIGTAGLGLVAWAPGCRTAGLGTGSRHLPRATPEAEGISSAAISAFLAAISPDKHEMHSFMLVRHGRVVAEGWWNPYGPGFNHTLYSLSKSFTSTAVGLAQAEGRLEVTDPVIKYFPEDLPEKVSENLTALRIRDLLSMSVGNGKEPTQDMVKDRNWARVFLAAPVAHPPGTAFMYNSGATYMCSAIVQKVTGQRLLDYLRPRLFEPLAIEGATWETCPRGIDVGGWGLSLQTESLAKFGQLYLQKGRWNGRQILPARWVEEATSFKIQQPLPAKPGRPNERNDWLQGYGYQFWRSTHNAYRGDGAFGQYTIVLPEEEAVIAITSETKDMQGLLDLVWDFLLPGMKGSPLPADLRAQSELEQTLGSLALPLPQGRAAGAMAHGVYELEANELGLRSAGFEFRGGDCRFTLKDSLQAYPILCGLGQWRRGETALPGTPPRLVSGGAPTSGTPAKIAASGAWKDSSNFEMMWRYYETPHHDSVTCAFEGNKVAIAFMNSMAKMSPTPKDGRPVLRGVEA